MKPLPALSCCPTCGRKLPASKPVRVVRQAIDTSSLSHAELYAHYKRTAPLEDVRFTLRYGVLSPSLRAGFEALLAVAETLNRTAFYRQYNELQALARVESNHRWREEHFTEVPAVFEKTA